MSSLLNNPAALSALQSLQMTQQSLNYGSESSFDRPQSRQRRRQFVLLVDRDPAQLRQRRRVGLQ